MSLLKPKKNEQEQKLYELIKRNTELESQVKLFETTIEQLKRAFDKQEKVVDQTKLLEEEITQYKSHIDELNIKINNMETLLKEDQQVMSDIEKNNKFIRSETDKLTEENQNLTAEVNNLTVKLQELEQENTNLQNDNKYLSSSNKELLDKSGWVRTGASKDDNIGYYGHSQYIKVKKNHLSENPENISETTVTFGDGTTYPLSLMLFLWGAK